MNNKIVFEIIENNFEFRKNSNFKIETIYLKQSLFNIHEIIKNIFKKKIICDYDYIIIKSNKLHFLSEKLLNNFIKEMNTEFLIGIRHSDIYVNNPKHSPRLPYIDPHIFILNTKHSRFHKLVQSIKYKEPSKVNNNYQKLINFMEFNFYKNEVLNFFKGETYNEYGDEQTYIDPYPFSLCKKTGILILYQEYSNGCKKILNKIEKFEFDKDFNFIFINKNKLINILKYFTNKLLIKISASVSNRKKFNEIKRNFENK